MTCYKVRSRVSRWLAAALYFGFAVFFGGGAMVSIVENHASTGAMFRFLFLSMFAFASTIATIRTLRKPCQIQVGIDGRVTVVRALGSDRLRVDEIRSLEGRYEHDYHDYVWRLVLRTADRAVTVDEFRDVMLLVHRIEALNPRVEIRGVWPTAAPAPSSRGLHETGS